MRDLDERPEQINLGEAVALSQAVVMELTFEPGPVRISSAEVAGAWVRRVSLLLEYP